MASYVEATSGKAGVIVGHGPGGTPTTPPFGTSKGYPVWPSHGQGGSPSTTFPGGVVPTQYDIGTWLVVIIGVLLVGVAYEKGGKLGRLFVVVVVLGTLLTATYQKLI